MYWAGVCQVMSRELFHQELGVRTMFLLDIVGKIRSKFAGLYTKAKLDNVIYDLQLFAYMMAVPVVLSFN
jgi:hypothetical protein